MVAVTFQMTYRILGMLWFRVEDPLKRLWDSSFDWWCCCTCCWHKHKVLRMVRRKQKIDKRHVGKIQRGTDMNIKSSDIDDFDVTEAEEEKNWGVQNLQDYTGYGVVQGKPEVDPSGNVRRPSQLLGWDQEMGDEKREKRLGRRESIFDSGKPIPVGGGKRTFVTLNNADGGQTVPPGYGSNEASKDGNGATDGAAASKKYPNSMTDRPEQQSSGNTGKRFRTHESSSDNSCDSAELETWLKEGQNVVDGMLKKLDQSGTGDHDERFGAVEFHPVDNKRVKLEGDTRPLWRPNKKKKRPETPDSDDDYAKGDKHLHGGRSAEKTNGDAFSNGDEQFGERSDGGKKSTKADDDRNGVNADDVEQAGHEVAMSKHTSDSDYDTDADDSIGDANDSEPDESKNRGPRGPSFLRRRLSSSEMSHELDTDEMNFLDYTPAINKRPSKFASPLRITRQRRNIALFVTIAYYKEPLEHLKR